MDLEEFYKLAGVDTSNTDPDACWEWKGNYFVGDGYGRVEYGQFRGKLAHRVVLEFVTGPLGKLYALHHCDNPPCVRPTHLWRGTQQDNVNDMIAKGRHSHGDDHWSAKYARDEGDYQIAPGLKKGAGATGDRHGTHTHPEAYPRGDDHWTHRRPELLARGDQNGMRLHPERAPRGDRNGSRLHPESRPRGDRHYSHTNPELVPRGDNHYLRRHPELKITGDAHWARRHPEKWKAAVELGRQRRRERKQMEQMEGEG